ncbi:MAG: putative phage abortive infection protein [Acidovorax sp.]|uniref:putative phage abortive infection protein n=1 Tax=Acidovorax sp. TaxID=1872122 RepID=UPI00391CC13A
MTKENQTEPFSDDEFPDFLLKIGLAVFVFAILVVSVFAFKFSNQPISDSAGDWGTFGDYVGGLLNPAVGLATVLLVIISIVTQRKELRASLKEMKAANEAAAQMSFEQSMFAWLGNYHSQIKEIERENYRGRMVMQHLYQQALSPLKTIAFGGAHLNIPVVLDSDSAANEAYIRINTPGPNGIKQMGERQFFATIEYQKLYHTHKSDFDAPFRTLYRLIRWIDESPMAIERKWHYCALVRSQLSWIELVFLYYNGLIREGEKLAFYANKYAIFDNLVSSDELIRWASDELTMCPAAQRPKTRDGDARWPYKAEAFQSSLAKIQLGLPPNT